MQIKCAADFADWYDTDARKVTDEVLTEFVHANPTFIGIYVASGLQNSFDLGSMFFVDVMRLGTGTVEGVGGFVEDILRALSVLPIGKVAAVGRPLIASFTHGITSFFYWSRLTGNSCVGITFGKALQFTGQSVLVRLDKISLAMGKTAEYFALNGALQSSLRRGLNELKAHYDELPAGVAQGWDDIVMYAQNTEGVIIVSVKHADGTRFGHQIFVAKTFAGVRIFDRYGVFKSLDELSRRYNAIKPNDLYVINTNNPIFIVKNWVLDPALANRLNAMGPVGAVLVKVGMVIGFNPNIPADSIKDAFRAHIARKNPHELYPAPVQPPQMDSLMFTHTITGPRILESDWLSNIAKKWYGDVLLWPILFDYNRGPDFQDPNKMFVGQRVKVPFINDKSPEDITYYRNRGRNWR